mmetsp:Transcript_24564/g.66988  ORF Transcript_24564/g.66988 Transcript_24564/m.66988 type:complete len:424 (+) Transcript_24564:62-1333(+)|eukprot:CAMPEP_0202365942 /NCGR_PEP_ID=MMETSP1126-20121109/16761_1 /ASSEMBLY_ACC=CAM_ASM_000457 /TAXON_ID=3047 /ORGANISM="Dunaliella tertiolecta, Strain CCMP1320" /LENGTH=423 /DNA_ID=CAMNT_0048960911 /DNA_START=72 /DNA_END=1343 /DNA_ORIENTATION=-
MPTLLSSATDEDSFLVIADSVANLLNEGAGQVKTALAETPGSKFLEECSTLLQAEQFEQFLIKMQSHLDMVFSKCTDKESECIANILVHAVPRVPADRMLAAAQGLAAALTAKVDERADERLGALLNLYGVSHEQPVTQRAVLLKAADYARNLPRLAAILVPAVRGKSQQWVRQWNLNEAESRELLIALATLIKIGTDRASVKEYIRLVTAALALCQENDSAAITQLRPLAVAAVTDFIRSPSIYQADFADSPAVKALAKDKAVAPIYSLFTATLSGDLGSFRSAAQPAVLEQVGVSGEAALTKARLVALLALCSGGSCKEVPFSRIQSALDIPANAVESWIVRAIGAKLIEGKIDQVQDMVVVSRCTQRTFGAPEWAALRSQLAAWRESLHGAQQLLGSMQMAAKTGPAGAQGNKPAIAAAI